MTISCVQYTMCIALSAVYIVQGPVYAVRCTRYSVRGTVYAVCRPKKLQKNLATDLHVLIHLINV